MNLNEFFDRRKKTEITNKIRRGRKVCVSVSGGEGGGLLLTPEY